MLFLRGARTGSPRRRLARMPPAKMTSMEETQRERGCFLEKGSEPAVILVSSNGAAILYSTISETAAFKMVGLEMSPSLNV